jgi:hypothetical protein
MLERGLQFTKRRSLKRPATPDRPAYLQDFIR